MNVEVTLVVNGEERRGNTEARTHLADYLRETHDLTGTHLGCEHGVCGACTIMIDGHPARSSVSNGPRTNSFNRCARNPSTPLMTTSASSASMTVNQSAAGSA